MPVVPEELVPRAESRAVRRIYATRGRHHTGESGHVHFSRVLVFEQISLGGGVFGVGVGWGEGVGSSDVHGG